jgi:hypothetical protein
VQQDPNYYTETDIWPGRPGARQLGRLIFGAGGEVYLAYPHYEQGIVQIR